MSALSGWPARSAFGRPLAAGWARLRQRALRRLVRQHRYPLLAHEGQFSGAGWELLRAEVAGSQAVLLGESHGIAQIPRLAEALADVLDPTLYVAELDPYVAQELPRLAAVPGGPAAYLRRYPAALCLASWAEEFELARHLLARSVRVVGIDQVFAACAGPFYARLADLVASEAARTYLLRRAAAYQAHDQAGERQGDELTARAMLVQTPADLADLRDLVSPESAAVQQLVEDYATSHTIYQTQSHQCRVNLLRRNLLRALWPGPASTGLVVPRTLVKLGAYHLARGLSTLAGGEYYDVGNLLQNLVEAQGQQSLHLFVVGRQGTKAVNFNPYFPDQNVVAYSAEADELRWLAPFLDVAAGPAWSVIDVRPIREAFAAGELRVTDQAMQRLLLGYDLLLVVPETTASSPL